MAYIQPPLSLSGSFGKAKGSPQHYDDKTILVVSSDGVLGASLDVALSGKNYQVHQAACVKDALSHMESYSFRLIVVDLGMPHTNGPGFIKEVRRRYPHVWIIIVSGYGSLEQTIEATRIGAHDYLIKPYDMVELIDSIECFMGKAGRSEELERLAREPRSWERRMERELEKARAIQGSFLPPQPPVLKGYGVDAHYWPANELSGDFYDFFHLDEDRLAVIVGDVAGNGFGAAMLMAHLTGEFHAVSFREQSPTRVLQAVNERLLHTADHDIFTTLLYVEIELSSRRLTLAGAGHPRPVLCGSSNGMRLLECGDNAPLGIRSQSEFTESRCRMEPGDTLLLFTDGLYEVRNPQGQPYSPAHLEACLSGLPRGNGSHAKAVRDDLAAFAAGTPIGGDITLVSIESL